MPGRSQAVLRTLHIGRRADHPFLVPPAARQDPTGLALSGSPGPELEWMIYRGDFLGAQFGTGMRTRLTGSVVVPLVRAETAGLTR
jgi:hypothetical protein